MKKSTAVLIIDIQNGYINKYTKKLPYLVEELQNEYEHVVVTQLEYSEHSPFLEIRKDNGFNNVKNPTGLAFKQIDKSILLKKHGYSAVTQELISIIEKNSIRQFDIAGVDTDQCVLATALALFDIGVRPIILSKYCASSGGEDAHKTGMKVLRRALGSENII